MIAHDYLSQRGGAERVVLSLLRAFLEARVVSSVYGLLSQPSSLALSARGVPVPRSTFQPALSIIRPTLVAWDRRKAATADRYIANSTVVKDRIRAAYGLQAEIVHPPAGVHIAQEQQVVPGLQAGYVLTVSPSRGYKNTDVVCQALARRPESTLVVLGGLPAGTWPSNIVGLNDLSDAQLRWVYANCSALVAVGQEDFGLTVPEVWSFGRPVVAWRAGGYLDTVADGINGVFIDEPTPDHILDGLDRLSAIHLARAGVLADARRFDERTFISRIPGVVAKVLEERPSSTSVNLRRGQGADPLSPQP